MLVWGGLDSSFLPLGDGGIYDAGTDTWSPIALAGAPSPRAGHTAIWTGTKMVIFGGANTELPGTPANLFNDGAAFDPLTGTWSPLDPVAAPAARHRHEALWTGSEMLVVGGEQAGGAAVTTAAAYNPTSDSWRPLPSFSASSAGQTTVWSGALVLVFGPNGLQSLDPSPAVHFYARF
jgi:N-acetylneuraminic acid mutarotase